MVEPLHKRELFPEAGTPFGGRSGAKRRTAMRAIASTLDGVAGGKIIARQKRFDRHRDRLWCSFRSIFCALRKKRSEPSNTHLTLGHATKGRMDFGYIMNASGEPVSKYRVQVVYSVHPEIILISRAPTSLEHRSPIWGPHLFGKAAVWDGSCPTEPPANLGQSQDNPTACA